MWSGITWWDWTHAHQRNWILTSAPLATSSWSVFDAHHRAMNRLHANIFFSSFYWWHIEYKGWMCERLLNLQEIYVSGQNICIEVYGNSVGTVTPCAPASRHKFTYFITITKHTLLFRSWEIRFYSCRPVHAPEWLALAMLKHEVHVIASRLAGYDIN